MAPSFKDGFDRLTNGGYAWSYDVNSTPTNLHGSVSVNGTNIPTSWVYANDGSFDLVSQGNAASYSVRRRLQAFTPTYPTRAFAAPFVVDPTRQSFCTYVVELTTSLTITGTSTATVGLWIGGILVATAKDQLTLGLGLLSLAQTHTGQYTLSGYVAANTIVELRATDLDATSSATFISAQEVIL